MQKRDSQIPPSLKALREKAPMMRMGFQNFSHFSLESWMQGSKGAKLRTDQGRRGEKEQKFQKEMRQERYLERGTQLTKNQRKRENQIFPSQEYSISQKLDSKREIEKRRKEPKERGKPSVLKEEKQVEERRNEEQSNSSSLSLISSRQEKDLFDHSKEADFEKANPKDPFSEFEVESGEFGSEEQVDFVLAKSFAYILEEIGRDSRSETGLSVQTEKSQEEVERREAEEESMYSG
jgi:hypothetical protein